MFTNPMYEALEANIPKHLMKHSDDSTLEDNPLFPNLEAVLQYLDQYARDVKHLIKFQTQVIDVRRATEDSGKEIWHVFSKDLRTNRCREDNYDAVAVANGHYSVPVIPDIPGIQQWNNAYPDRIIHSKFYRSRQRFKDKKVLVVGNSASGIDIASQISTVSRYPVLNSYRSEAPLFKFKTYWKKELPEIAEFLPPAEHSRALRFTNGDIESNVDEVVFCTGYFYSFPFLSSLEPPLVVTGERVEHLYKHIFYVDSPTLAFLGLPSKIIPFRICEGQATIIARVWSNRLNLPSAQDMRAWEAQRIVDRGAGKKFHEFRLLEDFRYHNEMVDWASQAKRSELGRLPPKWSKEEGYTRQRISAIKKTYAERGEERFKVKNLEELGFDYHRWLGTDAEAELELEQLLDPDSKH